MLSDWVSFLAYPNLFGIKGFVVVVVVVVCKRIRYGRIIAKSYPYPLLFFGYGYRYGSDNKQIQIRIGYYRIRNVDTDIIRIAKQNNYHKK
jgi:hypothetical protein